MKIAHFSSNSSILSMDDNNSNPVSTKAVDGSRDQTLKRVSPKHSIEFRCNITRSKVMVKLFSLLETYLKSSDYLDMDLIQSLTQINKAIHDAPGLINKFIRHRKKLEIFFITYEEQLSQYMMKDPFINKIMFAISANCFSRLAIMKSVIFRIGNYHGFDMEEQKDMYDDCVLCLNLKNFYA